MEKHQGIIRKLQGRTHTALYENATKKSHEFLAAYFVYGLEHNQLCIWITGKPVEIALGELEQYSNYDFRSCIRKGSLGIYNDLRTFAPAGRGEYDLMMENFNKFISNSSAGGYSSLCVVSELHWVGESRESETTVLVYENETNARLEEGGFTGLCVYPIKLLTKQLIKGSLRTHAQFVYEGALYANPYYVPPNQFNKASLFDLESKTTSYFNRDPVVLASAGPLAAVKPFDKVVQELLKG